MGVKNRPQCYFDVEINRAPVGRIVFELFSDVCPKTCKNFHFLCTGEKGLGKKTRKQLCYKGSTFHRIVKEFMIQGGDFSEGNGRGGESIYGGYFEDENFVLKHDREFLLSMANRGRDTNGSQFFITTKPAPHLDGVHVVFGQVITGFDAIKEIENLKTDAASRPYADVRIIDCGEFVPKSASHVTERKKKVTISYSSHESATSSDSSTSSKSSDSETETEEERERRRKRKRKMKTKHSKRRRETRSKKRKVSSSQKSNHNGVDEEDEKDRDLNPKRQKLSVRPEEIPPVPENRFLLRRDVPKPDTEPKLQEPPSTVSEQKPVVSKSGRKIKGRGTMRYRTPSKSRSHSESELDEETSETPPHWKEEMQRVRTYRAASLEKWTKGDKLKSESRRWSDRSASPWSRSWSHDGYYSDDRRRRKSSRYKRPKKERRKIKAKKKSKKQKHSKRQKSHKHKTKEISVPSESVRSSSFKTKSSLEHEKKSPLTASSRHSSERVWSGSSSHLSSSGSTASRSCSRSKSGSRSRSRSHSRTRTRSRSRSGSRSRTSSRSRSRSRSRSSSSSISSRSRSTSKSSSKSKHKRKRSSRPHFENLNQKKLDTSRVGSKENEKIVTHAAAVEAVPAVPLSESPPPSRWRPGQKPWKPSYVRIQEAQAKLSETTPTLSSRDSKCSREDDLSPSLRKQHRNSETRRHYNSDHESNRSSTSGYQKSSRSRGFSSRSRTRSSSGSRSRSSSRSRSVTKSPYCESSYSKSSSHSYESEEACVASSEEKYGKIKKKNSVSSKQDKERQASSAASNASKERNTGKKYESIERSVSSSHCSSESDSDEYERERGKSESKRLVVSNSKTEFPKKNRSSKKSEGKSDRSSKSSAKDHLNVKAISADDQVQKSRKKSVRNKSSERKSASGSQSKGEKSTKKVHKKARLKSETESETERSRNSKVQSGSTSEEGELVQKSDVGETEGKASGGGMNSRSEVCSAKSSASSGSEVGGKQPSGRKASVSSSSSGSASESEKRRKKKVKHKLKSKKKSRSKSAKFKKKSEKKKVKKVQKTKEKFHWQPPLEFGEEEEEETKTDGPGTLDGKSKVRTTPPKVGSHDTETNVVNCTASIKVSHTVKENTEPHEAPPVTSSHRKEVESQPKQKGDSVKAEATVAKAPGAAEKARTPHQNVRSSTPEKCTSVPVAQKGSEEASLSGAGDCKGAKGTGVKSDSSVSAEKGEQNKNEKNGAESAQPPDVNGNATEGSTKTENELTDSNKWKPLKVLPNVPTASPVVNTEVKVEAAESDNKPQGLKIEIKSKNKVKPGSLFDEVRRTARLNQRQRNQETSSEEDSLSRDSNSRSRSRSTSRGHYRSSSRDRTHSRTRSRSSSRSRSRSRSYSSSYRSRSYSRSRSRRRHSRDHSSHSSSYRSYRSHRTYSRSRSRSPSSSRHRRSRSDSYDSYDSRSRSRSRSRSYHKSRRSRSRDRSYRSYRSYSRATGVILPPSEPQRE
ncbi:NK-tumor recognition protein isoform X3 [Pristis pectinata]|uniref:NK-tumor recognition protein isoform X3 n=1 Tax=Pristis pectinata TaxID=685728 RepID=UPI00223C9510|nr:NK-tumor recognition protein isoform X3 [Pristis pectinata]